MPASKTPSGVHEKEVLTLAEASAYLRVPEDAVLEMLAQRELPAQKIRGEGNTVRLDCCSGRGVMRGMNRRRFGYELFGIVSSVLAAGKALRVATRAA